MLTYTLSKEETHQMLVLLESAISPFSPLNNFLMDCEINDSKSSITETMINLKKKKLFPPPFSLVNAYDVLSQPDKACSALLRDDEKKLESNFFIKSESVVEYNYSKEGTNYIHEGMTKSELISAISKGFTFQNASSRRKRAMEERYVFSYPEYVVMVAILCLEKDKDVLEIIGEVDYNGITKENILDYIRAEEQFDSLWLIIGLNLLDVDDFLNDIDNEVAKIIDSLNSKGYIKKSNSENFLTITKDMYPLLDYISSYKKALLSLSVEQYPHQNNSSAYQSGTAFLLGENSAFSIQFKDSKLHFYQLYSKEQVEKIVSEAIFSTPIHMENEEVVERSKSNRKAVPLKKISKKIKKCSTCGSELFSDAKFCTHCGAEVHQNSTQSSEPMAKKLMEDRIRPLPSLTIGIYFMLNVLLYMWSPYNDEIRGIFIYTWIVLAIIFIRRNREEPFNWLLNIFVLLQAILVFATAMMTLEYVGNGADSIPSIIELGLLTSLFMSIVVLLYKGNRKSS